MPQQADGGPPRPHGVLGGARHVPWMRERRTRIQPGGQGDDRAARFVRRVGDGAALPADGCLPV